MKLNCWEYMKCEREVGGKLAKKNKACPASKEAILDGVHHGDKAGRACWVISGTLCGDDVQGVFASKMGRCLLCEFYKSVKFEEKNDFRMPSELIDLMLAHR